MRATRSTSQRFRAFTLTELLVASTLSLLVLAGVLSAFVMIGRSGYLASAYSELENETRRGLQVFGDDARRAVDLQWNSAQSVTLRLPTATGATVPVTYAYDGARHTATAGCFYRVVGEAASTNPRLILVRRVASDFAFQRFKLETAHGDNLASSDLETKQLQVTLRASRAGATTVAANQSALSARYVLRNKRVSN
ncbi:MAG: prepilin-type N-terminal cleavage/methylation domain-containing protein [Verrucomicrobia bacterium]|nr:prepilin-type N-terminal cleavage/methylation domain-containing protein [Verrucomicrobiota bacterium]